MLDKLCREQLAVGAASYLAPALAILGVNPGYGIDDQQRVDVVAHRTAAFDNPTLGSGSSFFSTRTHRFVMSRRVSRTRVDCGHGADLSFSKSH